MPPGRLVFAKLGRGCGDMPEVLDDGTILTPQNSYGAQKAIGELLLNDGRKGFVDGRGAAPADRRRAPGPAELGRLDLREPIIREPLAGRRRSARWRATRPCTSCRPGAWSRP